MEIRPGVHSFDLPWSYAGYSEPLSVHVLETEEAVVLFGSGAESTTADLLDVVDGFDLDAVIVEHGDVDHFGGVQTVRESIDDGVDVAVPAGDVHLLEEAGIEPDIALEPGERYWGIETIPAPGHTPDNMSYLYEEVLVAGDTVAGSDSPFAMQGGWPGKLAPLMDDLHDDVEEALESIAVLGEFEFDVVLTTHGQHVQSDGSAEIQDLIAALED
ncbi:MAG: MBL fold metallo-hydrolase [Halodesulfurarchaeum sp.]